MPAPFEPLRDTLLRAGVAPVHVRRYLRELSEHFSDLVGEEREAGKNAAEADAAAHARLGGDEALAGAMLAQPSLRSWTGRAPWATLVGGPILLVVLAWVPAIAASILLSGIPVHLSGTPLPPDWRPPHPSPWLRPVTETLLDFAEVGGPIVIGAWVALLAARQRSHLIWPLVGCVVVALLGASLVCDVHWPTVGPLGRLTWSFSGGVRGLHTSRSGTSFSFGDWSHGLPLAAFSLAAAGAVYWAVRRRALAT